MRLVKVSTASTRHSGRPQTTYAPRWRTWSCAVVVLLALATSCTGGPFDVDSPPLRLGTPTNQSCGKPTDVSMERYRAWHEAHGLKLEKCWVECGNRRSVCLSTDSNGRERQHICNGHFDCHDM